MADESDAAPSVTTLLHHSGACLFGRRFVELTLGHGGALRSLLLDNQRVLDAVERLMPDFCCLDAAAVRFRGETPWCVPPPAVRCDVGARGCSRAASCP